VRLEGLSGWLLIAHIDLESDYGRCGLPPITCWGKNLEPIQVPITVLGVKRTEIRNGTLNAMT
jgi:hypothetical protein